MDLFKKPNFRCKRKTGEPREKHAEGTKTAKPNVCTEPGPRIKLGLSGAQRLQDYKYIPNYNKYDYTSLMW